MAEDASKPSSIVGAVKALAEPAKALAEPARLAIERLSAGMGRLYEPTHLRRMAKAKADKKFIDAIGREDVSELLEAAEDRENFRKVRQELNLKLIADRVTRHFQEGVPPDSSAPADEWVDEFTDRSKDASTDELRELWARLFAAETKQSGAVPRRILRTVRDLDASLARSFTALISCCTTADDGRMNLLACDGWSNGVGLTLRNLRELEDVGLVQIPTLNSTVGSGLYRFNQDRLLRLTFENGKNWHLGIVSLTSAGIAIAAVAERGVNQQYVNNLRAAAEKAGAKVEYPLALKPAN